MKRMHSNMASAAVAAFLVILVARPVVAADPQVSNVTAVQRPGTMLVDITYDLISE